MTNITLIKDYRNTYGSKHFDTPYRSGFDQHLLKQNFLEHNINATFREFQSIDFSTVSNGELFLYTSSEDIGTLYKSFIEDIILGLELSGAITIPSFKYLRAHNNKVFMEALRNIELPQFKTGLASHFFGTLEELEQSVNSLSFPCVLKTAGESSGRGVYLTKNQRDLLAKAKKISRSKYLRSEWWDFGRSLKHKGYIKESRYRRKFIVQDFIPGLKNDWKIYIFGNRYYIFYRPILKGRGIKASGGGYDNYTYGSEAPKPEGIFEFARSVFNSLDVPHLSIDVAYDGENFYLIEFQALYFGTAGIAYSNDYYSFIDNKWVARKEKLEQEKVYTDSIVHFLQRKDLI